MTAERVDVGRTAEAAAWTPARLTALVFAGSSGAPAHEGGRNKNYFPLRRRPVVQRQLDLVRELGFARTVLVTETARLGALDLDKDVIVLPSSRRQWENFATVKREVPFGPDERGLVLFGDTPVLTPGVVRDFLARCRARPADLQHGLVPYVFAEPFMDYFPRDRKGRRPFHVAEFTARLGCLTLVRPAVFDPEATRESVAAVMHGRKQDPDGGLLAVLVARARVLWGGLRFFGLQGAWLGGSAVVSHWFHERGFPDAARFTSRPVTLARLDAITTRLVGCPARLLPCPFGGASLDIDTEMDVTVHELYFDHMLRLTALQERLAVQLVEPGFEVTSQQLGDLERFDPEAAAEMRRHPEVYREQQRILRQFAAVVRDRKAAPAA